MTTSGTPKGSISCGVVDGVFVTAKQAGVLVNTPAGDTITKNNEALERYCGLRPSKRR